jgi:hypothetical protein
MNSEPRHLGNPPLSRANMGCNPASQLFPQLFHSVRHRAGSFAPRVHLWGTFSLAIDRNRLKLGRFRLTTSGVSTLI